MSHTGMTLLTIQQYKQTLTNQVKTNVQEEELHVINYTLSSEIQIQDNLEDEV